MTDDPQPLDDSSNSFKDDKLDRFEQTLKLIRPRSADLDRALLIGSKKQSRSRVSMPAFAFASCCGGSALAGLLVGFVLFGTDDQKSADSVRPIAQRDPLPSSPSPVRRGVGSENYEGSYARNQIETRNRAEVNAQSERTPRRLTAGFLISKSNIELLMDDLSVIHHSMSSANSEISAANIDVTNDGTKRNTFIQLRREAQL